MHVPGSPEQSGPGRSALASEDPLLGSETSGSAVNQASTSDDRNYMTLSLHDFTFLGELLHASLANSNCCYAGWLSTLGIVRLVAC